jgi:hypothetical protein
MEPDSGITNIRNTNGKHCRRWLGVEHRCVVPFWTLPRPIGLRFLSRNRPRIGPAYALSSIKPRTQSVAPSTRVALGPAHFSDRVIEVN